MDSQFKSFFRLSLWDLTAFGFLLVSCQIFFVAQEKLWALATLAVGCLLFKFFKKPAHDQISLISFAALAAIGLAKIETALGKLAWPGDLFLAALILFGILKLFEVKSEKAHWRWKLTKNEGLSLAVIVLLSLTCLLPYFYFHRDVAKTWPFPDLHYGLMIPMILLIALFNGLREELYFRILLQKNLSGVSPNILPVLCASVMFGYLHFQSGFPRGYVGVLLTALFGLLVGLQYRYFKSAWLVCLTHAVTDAVMFVIIWQSRA